MSACGGANGRSLATLMVRVTTQITIARDIDDVFSYFADLRNEPAWNHGHVRHVVMTTPGPIGRGTAFVGDHPGFGTATWRITDFVRPSRIAIEGQVGSGTYRYVGELTPLQGATRFLGTVEWRPGGFLRSLSPLLTPILKFQARRSFTNLKNELER